mgnify:CR=1 FL=1|tara:strand:- start:576 stop:2897 length:2322 start_codon:yes stop_codon:yes gene_type:complete
MPYGSSVKSSNIKENWLVQLAFAHRSANGDGGYDQILQASGAANLVDDSGGFSSSATSFTIDDGDVLLAGDYIKIDNEIMLISKLSGDLIFIERGQLGTSAASHNDNAVVNWHNFVPLSFANTRDKGLFYHGVITNKPSIRESINLQKSIARTSNVTIQLHDFTYKGNRLSQDLFGTSNDYINREMRLLSKINDDDAFQIGTFRLNDIKLKNDIITLKFNTQRPFDDVQFPQTKTTSTNIYVPYVVGDYDENDSSFNTPAFCDTNLYPVPVHSVDEERIRTIMPRSYNSGSGSQINIHHGEDVFLPLQAQAGAATDATTTIENVDALETPTSRRAAGRVFALESRNRTGTNTEFNNTHLAFDRDIDTAASVSVSGSTNYAIGFTSVPEKWATHRLFNIRLRHKFSQNATFNVFVFQGSTEYADSTITFTANTFRADNFAPGVIKELGKQWTIIYQKTSGSDGTLSLGSVKLDIDTAFDTSDKDELKKLGDVKFFYSGANGLKDAWSDTAAMTEIHEVHRDLLVRFTDIGTTTPDGYSDLDSAKDWRIRYWQLDQKPLNSVLEKLQYEGGFIFRYRYNGNAQYIFVKDSYSTTDTTLSKDDIDNVQLEVTKLSDLLTKQEISYRKHPSESRYITTVVASNDTIRKRYNVGSNEKRESVNLDMYVGTTTSNNDIPASPSSNPNDDFYSYYDYISGDIKLLISFDIVNPSKWVTTNDTSNPLEPLEVGSIIDFNNDNMFPETPFGINSSSWSTIKFIITDLFREIGKVKIKARQIA